MTAPALVVLAGGAARRMGGADKTAAVVRGATLLEHALGAVPDARTVVAVGPPRETRGPVTWTREDPPGSGPAAALQAGLAAAGDGPVVLLAADLPRAADLAAALLADGADVDRVVVDQDGRAQWTAVLLSAASARALREAPPATDAALHALVEPLAPTPVTVPLGATRDVDTPEDLQDWKEPS